MFAYCVSLQHGHPSTSRPQLLVYHTEISSYLTFSFICKWRAEYKQRFLGDLYVLNIHLHYDQGPLATEGWGDVAVGVLTQT